MFSECAIAETTMAQQRIRAVGYKTRVKLKPTVSTRTVILNMQLVRKELRLGDFFD